MYLFICFIYTELSRTSFNVPFSKSNIDPAFVLEPEVEFNTKNPPLLSVASSNAISPASVNVMIADGTTG